MSRINFSQCDTIDDVVRLYGEELPGKVLIQCFQLDPTPYNILTERTPILGIEALRKQAILETEDEDYERVRLAFPLGLTVVTSVVEAGDIWWPNREGDWSIYYSIDDLSPADCDVDSVLRFAEHLPATSLFLQ